MRRSLPSDGAMNLTRDTLLPNQYPVKFYGYLQGKLGGNLVIFARKFTQKKGNSRIVKGNFTYNFTKARFPLGDFFCAKRLSIVKIEQISDQFQLTRQTKKSLRAKKSRLVENFRMDLFCVKINLGCCAGSFLDEAREFQATNPKRSKFWAFVRRILFLISKIKPVFHHFVSPKL